MRTPGTARVAHERMCAAAVSRGDAGTNANHGDGLSIVQPRQKRRDKLGLTKRHDCPIEEIDRCLHRPVEEIDGARVADIGCETQYYLLTFCNED